MTYLRKRESEREVRIIQVLSLRSNGRGVKYRVTMKDIRAYCPEFFRREPNELLPRFKRMAQDLKDHLDETLSVTVNERLTEALGKIDFLSKKLAEQHKRLSALESKAQNQPPNDRP